MSKIELTFDSRFNEWIMSYPANWYETRELFYDALELENIDEKESVKIYKRLLKKLPTCDLDSYTHYGDLLKNKKRIFEGKSLISRALVLAKCAVPEAYYLNPGSINWLDLDNRPLLRTFKFAALDYEEDGFYNEAENLYNFILKANPNDHQGIRFLLSSIYLKQENFESFYQHCDQQEFIGIDGSFGLIFADFKTNKIESAKERLSVYLADKPLIVKEILSNKHIKPDTLDFRLGMQDPGSVEEAYNYYQQMCDLWKSNPEFIQFLRSNKVGKSA